MRNRVRGLALAVLAVCLGLILRRRFRRWLIAQRHRLRRGSRRTLTALGTVEYRQVGAGPVILLVHGAPGGSDGWRLFAALAAGYTLLSPSRPGYLRTPLRSGHTWAKQADLLAALLDELKLGQVVVLGFSMGGPVALELARRHPTRVRGLVLLSAITHPHALDAPLEEMLVGSSWLPHRWQRVLFWLSHRLAYLAPRLAAYSLLSGAYNGPSVDDCVESLLASRSGKSMLHTILDSSVPLGPRQRGYDNDVQQSRRMPPAHLEDIHMPVLILHSPHDASVPFQHALYAAQHLPHAKLVSVSACGHFLMAGEAAEDAVTAIDRFIVSL